MTIHLFAEGRLSELSPDGRRHLLERAPADAPDVRNTVAALMEDVRQRGDAALLEMAHDFDGVDLDVVEVPTDRWHAAAAELDYGFVSALTRAADNIRTFHEAQLPEDVAVEVEPGVRITRRWAPLQRVGVYAPGGTAAYASSVLMGVVPARAAGVTDVIVCSPPARDTGEPPVEVMAACALAGATRLFAVGGAGAVAALAFGTQSIPAVDAVVGPGNRWVTEAKRQVAGRVVIDSPAGPSEVLVVADESANPRFVAAELLAQAEHDPEAACVLLAVGDDVGDDVAARVRVALTDLLADAPRADIAREALATHGAILVAADLDEAVDFAEAYAAEHLSIMTADAAGVAARIPTAGTTFVGRWASVVFGDYLTGANHVLPTEGRARSFSGLSTLHFLRSYTVQEIDEVGARSLAADVDRLARAEGLPAHALAARLRAPA